MKVTPVSRTLVDVLKGTFIKIPRFQRPYDWDRDNLVEFWADIKDRSEPEYFMGSLVSFADQKGKERYFTRRRPTAYHHNNYNASNDPQRP